MTGRMESAKQKKIAELDEKRRHAAQMGWKMTAKDLQRMIDALRASGR